MGTREDGINWKSIHFFRNFMKCFPIRFMFSMTASYSDVKNVNRLKKHSRSYRWAGSKILIIKVKWNGKKYPAIKSNFWHVQSLLLTSSFVIRLHIRLAERNWCDLFRCHLRNTLQPIKLTTCKQFKSISLHGARERTAINKKLSPSRMAELSWKARLNLGDSPSLLQIPGTTPVV